MENKTVSQWMQELASKKGKYTGGSAASTVAAISVSLAQFIFELQSGKKRYSDQELMIQAGIKKAAQLQKDFLKLVEKDVDAFQPVLPVYRMPQKTQEEKEIREKKLDESLADASKPPYEMMLKLDETINLYQQLAQLDLAGSLVVDIIIGLDIAIAALKSSKNSSVVNIDGITNVELKKTLTKKVKDQYQESLKKAKAIQQAAQTMLDEGG